MWVEGSCLRACSYSSGTLEESRKRKEVGQGSEETEGSWGWLGAMHATSGGSPHPRRPSAGPQAPPPRAPPSTLQHSAQHSAPAARRAPQSRTPYFRLLL